MYGAVDIGGTKTLIAVFDKNGKIVEQIKFPTPKNYTEFVKELAGSVAKLATKEFLSIGLAAPGRIDRSHGIGVRFGNLGWENVPVLHDAEKIFKAPGTIENDAKAAALAEARNLESKYSKVVYITISTGIGIALVQDGEIDQSVGDSGGNSMLMEHEGKYVSWESFASGKAISKKYGKRASDINDKSVWEKISRDFGVGIIDIISVMEPDVVIIGGGVGTHFEKYKEPLLEFMKRYETPMTNIPPIIRAKHPEEAVIYGCYELAKARHGHVAKKS